MKFSTTRIPFSLWLALALALLPALRAEETPTEAKQPVAEEAKPAAPLRDLTEPDKPAATDATSEAKPGKKEAMADDSDDSTSEPASSHEEKKHRHHHSGADNGRVGFGQNSTLAVGEHADAVVSIFGSSTSAGEVDDAVVSILGDSRVKGGTVGDSVVAVLGSNYINGHVKGEVVAVLGNIELGPDAIVDGEIVCIGGEVTRDPKAVTNGNVQNIAIGGHHFNFDGLHAWFIECLLYARPLAFDLRLWWAWGIAFTFLGFYVLLALVAPEAVNKCTQTLEERPGYSILTAVLALVLTPVVFILVVLTLAIGIGFALLPLLSLGLFFAGLFGKVVMLAWLGRRLTKLFGNGALAHPAFAVLIGGLIVLGLYTVPVLGFILYKLLGVVGLGVVVYTLILRAKSSRAAAATASAALGSSVPPPVGENPVPLVIPSLPPIISAATLPRAGFWRRLLATLLDLVIVAMVFGMLQKIFHGFGDVFPLWYAVYCVAMWATKGTTIGGIVCSLKVVRLDDRPVDWSVAVVRGLAAFLSLAVAGLGFIWVAFDDDKQSWHDKIAGTTIVIVPKGTPLV